MTSTNRPPKPEDAGPIPEDVQDAAMMLIAHTFNTGAMVFNMDLKKLAYEGADLGDWQISVCRMRGRTSSGKAF